MRKLSLDPDSSSGGITVYEGPGVRLEPKSEFDDVLGVSLTEEGW